MISQTHAERLLSENMPFPSVSAVHLWGMEKWTVFPPSIRVVVTVSCFALPLLCENRVDSGYLSVKTIMDSKFCILICLLLDTCTLCLKLFTKI